MSKLIEILHSGRPPFGKCGNPAVDPNSVFAKVPKALAEIEKGERKAKRPISAKEISKHFGMSVDFIKKQWSKPAAIGLFFAFTMACYGGTDITRGITFVDGQKINASQLHQLVDNATIPATFITAKTTHSFPANADYFLMSSGGVLYKVTYANIIANPLMLTGLAGDIPKSTDLMMFYSQTNNDLRSVSITNLYKNASSNINVSYLSYGGTNGYVLSNWTGSFYGFQTNNHPQTLWWGTNGIPYQQSLSNLETIFASDLGTNRNIPYVNKQLFYPWLVYGTNSTTNGFGYVTNFPITSIIVSNAATGTNGLATLSTNDTFPLFSTIQGTNTTLTLNALAQYFVTNYAPTNYIFTGTNNITAGTWTTNFAHNLGYTPSYVRWSMVCVATNATYVTNDEVDISSFVASGTRIFSFWYNSSNIYIVKNATIGTILQKDGANNANGLEAQWKPKCYYR